MKDWSIAIAERPFHLGPIDNYLFGRDAGHSFLRFKDGDGNIFLEMHGVAFDKASHMRVPNAAFSAGVYISTFAHMFNYNAAGPALRVEALSDPRDMASISRNRPVTEKLLLKDSPENIIRCLETALRAAQIINHNDIPYYSFGSHLYGQNCHSVMSELVDRMTGSCVVPDCMNFAAPGARTDLEPAAPALRTITRKDGDSKDAVFQSLQKNMQGLICNHADRMMNLLRTGLDISSQTFKPLQNTIS